MKREPLTFRECVLVVIIGITCLLGIGFGAIEHAYIQDLESQVPPPPPAPTVWDAWGQLSDSKVEAVCAAVESFGAEKAIQLFYSGSLEQNTEQLFVSRFRWTCFVEPALKRMLVGTDED